MASTINAQVTPVAGIITTGDASGNLALQTANVTALTITSDQNVGIGTSSPTYRLESSGSDASDFRGFGVYNTSTNSSSQSSISLHTANDGTAGRTRAVLAAFASATGNDGVFTISTRNAGGIYERMRLDSSGNLGLGVTPSASNLPTIQSGYAILTGNNQLNAMCNAYYNSGWLYTGTGYATQYQQLSGQHIWKTAASGTAGNVISFTQAMVLDSSGNLGLGVTPSAWTDFKGIQIGQRFSAVSEGTVADLYLNSYYASGSYRYIANGYATLYRQQDGNHIFYNATSGTAGNSFSYTERMRIDSSGNLKFNSGYGSVATAYGCRAWANFASNGSTLRASGGITSITVPSTGNITVNLSFTMPDTNYTYNVNTGLSTSASRSTAVTINCSGSTAVAPTTTAFSIGFLYGAGFTAANSDYINISVHR